MLCFFLFWLFQFPFTLIHPRKLRPIFLVKAITLPIVAVAMMGWTIHQAGDRAAEVMREPSKLHGLDGWYAFMTAVTACMGTWSSASRPSLLRPLSPLPLFASRPVPALTCCLLLPLQPWPATCVSLPLARPSSSLSSLAPLAPLAR